MSQLVFTPGQREEALTWIKENCPDFSSLLDFEITGMEDNLIDMFFKLRKVKFGIKPNEFLFGVQYQDKDAVLAGNEAINLSLLNPHNKGEYDVTAHQIAVSLLQRLKE